jgi:DNA primase
MDDSAKYLIHADFVANGVIERSDVVGAVFGQTEGLLGDDLDLRDLQQASKVGRIDVEVDSEGGRSNGEITIATSLDKVETAILAASLETIDRVGPCRSEVSISEIEDVRAAKRREVVERAKELLVEAFDESIMESSEILEEVRGSMRVEDITDYHGLPAGPRVENSDAIIVVEGRADVLTLLRYGVKNAIAVEGTNVPDAVAELSNERTVTAFLDGDRGGELILRELKQVGDVDYVAFAPDGRSVEGLTRTEVMTALRQKRPIREVTEDDLRPTTGENTDPRTAPPETTDTPSAHATDDEASAEAAESERPAEAVEATRDTDSVAGALNGDATVEEGPIEEGAVKDPPVDGEVIEEGAIEDSPVEEGAVEGSADDEPPTDAAAPEQSQTEASETDGSTTEEGEEKSSAVEGDAPAASLHEHVREVLEDGPAVRFLDSDLHKQAETDVEDAFEALEDAEPVPYAVIIDGELTQRLLDVVAQRGVEHVVASATGEYVKKPIGVRIRTVEELLDRAEAA